MLNLYYERKILLAELKKNKLLELCNSMDEIYEQIILYINKNQINELKLNNKNEIENLKNSYEKDNIEFKKESQN